MLEKYTISDLIAGSLCIFGLLLVFISIGCMVGLMIYEYRFTLKEVNRLYKKFTIIFIIGFIMCIISVFIFWKFWPRI